MQTPRELGYRWPAEWEPQQAVWFAWPHDDSLWPTDLAPVRETLARLIGLLTTAQRVNLLVQPAEEGGSNGAELLEAIDEHGVEHVRENLHFVPIATDDCWMRDTGPIFVNRGREQACVGWGFNGWGKFEPFETDAKVPPRAAKQLGLPLFVPGVVLEGGSLEGNGRGAVITTEQCLLHPNRNPGLGRAEIEKLLRDYLAVEQVVWLGEGLANDHTDGHVDVVTRFVGENKVVTNVVADRGDPSRAALAENLERLKGVRLADGRTLEVVELPLPAPVVFEGKRLAASYANFVIANGLVVVPTYDCPVDAKAVEILQHAFPDRRVQGLSATHLLRGGGAFHCLCQQQPAVG